SQRPLPIARHSGIPTGQRHCARNRSLPIACRSSSGSSFSHSRTGSAPVFVRKKISGIFFGGPSAISCTVLSTVYLRMCSRPLRPLESAAEVFHWDGGLQRYTGCDLPLSSRRLLLEFVLTKLLTKTRKPASGGLGND